MQELRNAYETQKLINAKPTNAESTGRPLPRGVRSQSHGRPTSGQQPHRTAPEPAETTVLADAERQEMTS